VRRAGAQTLGCPPVRSDRGHGEPSCYNPRFRSVTRARPRLRGTTCCGSLAIRSVARPSRRCFPACAPAHARHNSKRGNNLSLRKRGRLRRPNPGPATASAAAAIRARSSPNAGPTKPHRWRAIPMHAAESPDDLCRQRKRPRSAAATTNASAACPVSAVAIGKTTQRSGASIGRGTLPSESLQDRAVPGTTTVNRAGSGRLVPPLTAQRNFACVYPTATAQGGEASRSGEMRAYHGTGLPPAVIAR